MTDDDGVYWSLKHLSSNRPRGRGVVLRASTTELGKRTTAAETVKDWPVRARVATVDMDADDFVCGREFIWARKIPGENSFDSVVVV